MLDLKILFGLLATIVIIAQSPINASSSKHQRLNGFLGKRDDENNVSSLKQPAFFKTGRIDGVTRPRTLHGSRLTSSPTINENEFGKTMYKKAQPFRPIKSDSGRIYKIFRPNGFVGKRRESRPIHGVTDIADIADLPDFPDGKPAISGRPHFLPAQDVDQEATARQTYLKRSRSQKVQRPQAFFGKREPSGAKQEQKQKLHRLQGFFGKRHYDLPDEIIQTNALIGKRLPSSAEFKGIAEDNADKRDRPRSYRLQGFLGKRNGVGAGGIKKSGFSMDGVFGKRPMKTANNDLHQSENDGRSSKREIEEIDRLVVGPVGDCEPREVAHMGKRRNVHPSLSSNGFWMDHYEQLSDLAEKRTNQKRLAVITDKNGWRF